MQRRAMARGDQIRLRLARDIPGDLQGIRLLAALGSAEDIKFAADKLAMAERLAELGLPAPITCAVVTARQIPNMTAAPWTGGGRLVVKPRHGCAAKGLFSVVPANEGRFLIDGRAAIDPMELARMLMRGAQTDDLLIQPHIGPSGETRELSADAPVVVRVFAMRAGTGQRASVLSAFLKILPPGRHVPLGTNELLVVPVAVDTGLLEDGIPCSIAPRGALGTHATWNGALVRGRAVAVWSRSN